MLERKAFEKKVRQIRNMTSKWNNRGVVVISEYTKKGQEILARASRYEGNTLYQVYDRWSGEKQKAYDECYEMYCNSRHGSAFGICSHNSYGFTVSWVSDDGVHFITKDYEYLVICND